MTYYIQGKGGCFPFFRKRRITPINNDLSPSPSPPPRPPRPRPTRFFHNNIEYIDDLPNDDSWTSNETESEGEGINNPALHKLKELGHHYLKKQHSTIPFFQSPAI